MKEPFVIINADDYYGKEAFVKLHDFLVNGEDLGREFTMGMGGFILKNTLSDNGTVTRGVSVVDENGLLSQVHETTGIEMGEDGEIKCDDPKVQEWISPEDKVSMNMWAGYPEFIDYLAEDFKDFLANVKEGDLKSEYLLPNIVDKLLKEERANVKVLETQDRWFGVTYKEDKEIVQKAFAELIQNILIQKLELLRSCIFQFFFYLLQILLRVSTQYAVCPMQISEADFCTAFSDRDHTDQTVPFFFLLQIATEIGKIRLS